ncbi:hypothetical protein QYF61_008249, partial [Mycteria americana]
MGLLWPKCRTLHLALLNLIQLTSAHRSSLSGRPPLKQINTPARLGVICKLTEGALDPLIEIIDKDINTEPAPILSPGEHRFRAGSREEAAVMGLRRRSPAELHGPVLLSVCITALGKQVDSEVKTRQEELQKEWFSATARKIQESVELKLLDLAHLCAPKKNKMHGSCRLVFRSKHPAGKTGFGRSVSKEPLSAVSATEVIRELQMREASLERELKQLQEECRQRLDEIAEGSVVLLIYQLLLAHSAAKHSCIYRTAQITVLRWLYCEWEAARRASGLELELELLVLACTPRGATAERSLKEDRFSSRGAVLALRISDTSCEDHRQ